MRHFIFFFFVATLLVSTTDVHAQQNITADSLYTKARNAAFDHKDYDVAINYAQQALLKQPQYTEIIVFIGRVYAWKEDVDSAIYYFEKALSQDITFEPAYASYADVSFWNDNNEEALNILNTGLTYHPQSENLLLKKAKVLTDDRQYKEALLIVDTILALNNKNTEARALSAQIRDNVSKNRIGVRYDYVYFDKQFPDPWHLMSIDYTRQTKAGPITARVNYANRFQTSGLQYELEAYPRFSKTFYGYLNIGYAEKQSPRAVFPNWRAGASLYANLPKAFEAELGIRYLYFNSDVFIYTAYVGKYYKSFLFGARTYLTPNTTNIAQSYSALARYYYKGVDDYIGLMLSAGLSPDDRRVNVQLNSNYKLNTYAAELTARHAIRKLNIIMLNVSVLNQEYLKDTYGNQIQVGVGYIRRF